MKRAMLPVSYTHLDVYKRQVLQGFVVTMAVSLVFYVVVVGGLGLVRKRIPIPDGGNRIFVLLCAYGNDGFIGIPLAMQFFGSAGMLYAIAANIVFNITLFSFGIAVLQDKAKPDIKGILLNPCLICTVVALVLSALPFKMCIRDRLENFVNFGELRLGKERANRLFQIKDMMDAGLIVAGGTDAPVCTCLLYTARCV